MRSLALALLVLALVPAAARAQGAGTLTPTQTGFTWSRGAVTFDLASRDATWTLPEAEAVRAALDRLPDVLLRKANDVKVRRFYRDVQPIGSNGRPRPNAAATTVAEKGYVAFGDNVFRTPLDPTWIYMVVAHEVGHCAQYATVGKGPLLNKVQVAVLGTTNWTAISWVTPIANGFRSWNGFVSDYARTNDREDFAESVEFYWLAPDELLRVSPEKFVYMRDVVFEGEVSPPSSRVPTHRAIAPVRPEIARLSDARANPLSLVRVTGRHFMGPLDGGFNRVHYRGARALHLPISRSTVWSWVPVIGAGPAAVTVTTQDGVSDPEPFEVKKPWWKFW
ncbi:MAG: hypothetical protein M9894_22145 [Planctomycetes bacterium]|nr:hypothetical protein [Planctomycetota bacterium]